MFRAKTVFVIGAGASHDFSFPLGDKLLEEIAGAALFEFGSFSQQPSSGNQTIFEALRRLYWSDSRERPDKLNAILAGGQRLNVASPQYLSIDGLIENLQDADVTLMAKMAIASAILNAEATSPPFRAAIGSRSGRPMPNLPDLSGFQRTWYRALARCLFDGVTSERVDSVFQNVSFVIFNYDRCLEQYLYQALMIAYPTISEERAQRLVSEIDIVRPYGSVGMLPWQKGAAPKIAFGHGDVNGVIGAHQSIITFSEQVTDKTALDTAKRIVGSAARIVFLGFGFHRQNIEFLETTVRANCEIYGTVFNLPETEQIVIERSLRAAFGEGRLVKSHKGTETRSMFTVELVNCTCYDLCNHYWRTLTAETQPGLGKIGARA